MTQPRSTVTVIAIGLLMSATVAAIAAIGLLQRSTETAAGRPAAFSWLRPAAPPASWSVSRLPGSPAVLAYPPGWRVTHSDPGTRSAALLSASGSYAGYLNATPKSGAETLANWRHFRPAHIAEEGERRIRVLSSARHIQFRGATGSCLTEGYATSTTHRYREVACLVAGGKASTVVVAAAPPSRWGHMRPAIEQAISSFRT
jgi:hypothetical protein